MPSIPDDRMTTRGGEMNPEKKNEQEWTDTQARGREPRREVTWISMFRSTIDDDTPEEGRGEWGKFRYPLAAKRGKEEATDSTSNRALATVGSCDGGGEMNVTFWGGRG